MSLPSSQSVRRDHVRRPDLPWRVATLTECGKPILDVAAHISRAELLARIKRDGVQRAAYSTCMVCLETSHRWPEWASDPVQALAREFYGQREPTMLNELRALAALVESHRDEFDGYLVGLGETVSLDERRRARRLRGAS
jgi:hypothetical protein